MQHRTAGALDDAPARPERAAPLDDELDLLDLGLLLWHERGVVMATTVVIVALAALYAFAIAQPVYETEARLRPVAPGSLEHLAAPGVTANLGLNAASAFQRVVDQLDSAETRRRALARAQGATVDNPLEGQGTGPDGNISVALEPSLTDNNVAQSVSIAYRGSSPEVAARTVTALLEEAQARAAEELRAEREAVLTSRLEMLRSELAANIERARLEAAHRAARLRAAIATAESLSLADPVPLASLSPEPKTEDSLYLRGSKFLRAELSALEQLAKADPGTSLNGVEVEINTGQLQPAAFLPYAHKAASLQVEIEQVQALMQLPVDGVALARLDQPATLPAAPIAPNRGKILALAIVAGLVLGVCAALLRAAIRARFRASDGDAGAEGEGQALTG